MALGKEQGEMLWRERFDNWVDACHQKHNYKYSYPSKERVKDDNGRWKIEIVCPTHGSFFQAPEKHKFGRGCPYCSNNKKKDTGIEYATKHWPEITWVEEFSDAYQNKRAKGICPHHGEFNKLVTQLRGIVKSGKGHACPKCAKMKTGREARVPVSVWLQRIKANFPEYEVNESTIRKASDKVEVTCPSHGTWYPVLQDVAEGHGCGQCWKESKTSKGEKELSEFIQSLGLEVFENFFLEKQSVLHDGWVKDLGEFDVVAQRKDGSFVFIDYHGMYYHGDKVKRNPNAHVEKLEKLDNTGFQYIQVFEDEWKLQNSKVKNRLAHILGESTSVHYARKLLLEVIPWKKAEAFYHAHHLQGSGTKTSENYALMEGDEVISCMSFAKPRFDKEVDKELLRFASKGSVVGGFSRLLKAFKANNPNCKKLLSYADRRWSEGKIYSSSGFEFVGVTKPNYAWYKNLKKVTRYDAQRHKLNDLFCKEFPESWSESDIMRSEGYWKVYDAGNSKWLLTI